MCLEDKQSLIKLEKCACFYSLCLYIYNLYCDKVHTSFLVSHLWHVYIFHLIITKGDHLTSGGGGGGEGSTGSIN